MTIAHIFNGELGFDVRTKLNALIDLAGGAVAPFTAGSVLFADGSGNLAQDNANFFWDAINNSLKIDGSGAAQGAYYTGGKPAIFRVANGFGDNWFEDNAGNFAVTGWQNLGTGDGSLAMLSTGNYNCSLGSGSLSACTTGSKNMSIGTNSLLSLTTGTQNTAIGNSALGLLITTSDNVGIGDNALNSYTASNSVAVGSQAGISLHNGSNNIMLGKGADLNGTANSCVVIGGMFISPSRDGVICFGDGGGSLQQDFGQTTQNVWSYSDRANFSPVGLHIYNANAGGAYERVCLDWTLTSNVFRIASQSFFGTTRLIAVDGFAKAGAPAASDLPASSFAVIDDTSANKTWLAFNKAGTIRQTEIGGGGGGGMSIGGAITSATAGSVLFAGAAGVLAQDNTNFFWDDALNDLHIGGAYYCLAARALYVVPNVTENNWFEGNAGNQTVTGYGNFGTGDLALSSITSGFDNVAIGSSAAKFMTSGSENFAMGSYAMWFNQTDAKNVAIGYQALATLGLSGAGVGGNEKNIGIGYGALNNVSIAFNNVVLGSAGLSNVVAPTTATFNTIIGAGAASQMGVGGGSTVDANIIVGAGAALNLTGASSRNTFLGGYRGPAAVCNDKIAVSTGHAHGLLDLDVTTFWRWSMTFYGYNIPTGLHIYNKQDSVGVATNFERACIDWVDVSNVLRIGAEAGGSGVLRLTAFVGYPKAGAPAASDLPSGSFALIDDTSGGATWLVYNKAGTIRKVQLT